MLVCVRPQTLIAVHCIWTTFRTLTLFRTLFRSLFLMPSAPSVPADFLLNLKAPPPFTHQVFYSLRAKRVETLIILKTPLVLWDKNGQKATKQEKTKKTRSSTGALTRSTGKSRKLEIIPSSWRFCSLYNSGVVAGKACVDN